MCLRLQQGWASPLTKTWRALCSQSIQISMFQIKTNSYYIIHISSRDTNKGNIIFLKILFLLVLSMIKWLSIWHWLIVEACQICSDVIFVLSYNDKLRRNFFFINPWIILFRKFWKTKPALLYLEREKRKINIYHLSFSPAHHMLMDLVVPIVFSLLPDKKEKLRKAMTQC